MKKYVILTSACTVAFAGLALGQDRKPLPPPPEKRVGLPRIENMDELRGAYQRAGSPRLLVAVDGGGSGRAHDMAQVLSAKLEDVLRDPTFVIVSPEASAYKKLRESEVLARNDEFAAARMLALDAGADVVLRVNVEESRASTTGLRGTYALTDLRQGTSLGKHAWDFVPDPVNGGFDAYRMSEYANAIGSRVATQIADAFPDLPGGGALRRYTLRIVGDYQDDDLTSLRDAIQASAGIVPQSVVLRAQEQSSAQQVTTMELLSGLDELAVRSALRRTIADNLAMDALVLDARTTSIDVRLAPLGISRREHSLSGGPRTHGNAVERDAFTSAYANAGRPTFAVVVNRAQAGVQTLPAAPTPQPSQPAAQQGDGVNIIVGDRVGSGGFGFFDPLLADVIRQEYADQRTERAEQGEVDLRSLEGRLVERFVTLGVNVRDVSGAQAQLGAEGGPGLRSDDRALAHQLASTAGADVVVSGVARVVRARSGGYPLRIQFTATAFRVNGGAVLGAASVEREVASAGATLSQALDAIATEAVGRIAGQLEGALSRGQ